MLHVSIHCSNNLADENPHSVHKYGYFGVVLMHAMPTRNSAHKYNICIMYGLHWLHIPMWLGTYYNLIQVDSIPMYVYIISLFYYYIIILLYHITSHHTTPHHTTPHTHHTTPHHSTPHHTTPHHTTPHHTTPHHITSHHIIFMETRFDAYFISRQVWYWT